MYSNANHKMSGNVPAGANAEDSDGGSVGWISWFCDLEGHEFFIEVSLVLTNLN
jgi:hypothetical protein